MDRLFRRRTTKRTTARPDTGSHARRGWLRGRVPRHMFGRVSPTLRGEGRSFMLDEALPGAIAGLVGGTIMLLLYMPTSMALGQSFWTLPKLIGAVLWRGAELEDLGAIAVFVGLALHYAVSCGLATLFAMLLPRQEVNYIALSGLAVIYAMVTYAVLTFFVVEWADRLFQRAFIAPMFFLSQLAWGWTLASIQPLRRWLHARYHHERGLSGQRTPVATAPGEPAHA